MAAAGSEEQLAWEASQRMRAAVAAAVAALFLLGSDIWIGIAFQDRPLPSFLESIARLPAPGSIGEQESLRVASFEFFQRHEAVRIATAAMRAIGLVALAWAMTFLAVATRARRAEMARPFIYAALFGALLLAVEAVMRTAADITALNAFLEGPRTVAEVDDLGGSLAVSAAILQWVGQFAVAIGFVVVSLNAMRTGLLTRFMGFLGIIVGFLLVVAPPTSAPVQAAWLLALAALFSGRWPGGEPPAWRTGRAEPWPTQQELREARDRAKVDGGGGKGSPARKKPAGDEPAAAAVAAGGTPHPASNKRKRKRRT